ADTSTTQIYTLSLHDALPISLDYYLQNLTITENYSDLKSCELVIECTLENKEIKEAVFKKIEAVISPEALLTSNTSAIPISVLRSEEHTSELQSRENLVCRLL